MCRLLRLVLAGLSFCLISVFAEDSRLAEDHFLVLAGGYSPTGNQVSLEKNVLFFRKVLEEQDIPADSCEEYFADGNDEKGRDIQFEPEEEFVPRAHQLMAQFFGRENYQNLQYRNHELGQIDGKTSPNGIEQWFADQGQKLSEGDRLIIYATAHGGRGGKKEEQRNTKLYLWDNRSIDVRTLGEKIDTLPPGVNVVLVMAQCYAGGFAHVIYEDVLKDQALRGRSICGFFATTHLRTAAGCTPDINEANYQEFSTHFWAGIRGSNRLDEPIASPDYNSDGKVTFHEAHAYTALVSDTTDIPIKTSGVLLRAKSAFRSKERPDLLPKNVAYERVAEMAYPTDRALLEGLSQELGLKSGDRYTESVKAAEKIEAERKKLADQNQAKRKTQDQAKNAIRSQLFRRWPELNNVLTPQATALLTTESEDFVWEIESHPRYAEWKKLREERDELEDKRFQLEKTWAKHQRFQRAVENVILAANLAEVADEKTMEAYQQMVALEEGGL